MDYPYLIYYLILMLLAFLYWKYHDKRIVTFSLVLTFVFFAFRAPVVGADTWNYVRYLNGERYFYNDDVRDLEVLFVLYREILSNITHSRLVVMLVNTILSFAPLYYITKKYSKNVPLSILLFALFGVMTVYFIALRQVLSLSLLYIGLIFFIETNTNKHIKFIILILFGIAAYFVHTTSIFYLIIIFFSLIPIKNRWYYYTMIVASGLLGFVLNILNVHTLLEFAIGSGSPASERLIWYVDSEEYEGAMSLTMLLRMSFVAIISIHFMNDTKISHPFCKLFVAGVIIYNLLYAMPMVQRLVNPLYFFGTIVFTWIMGEKYRLNIKTHRKVNILIIVIVLYFARFNILELSVTNVYNASRMHPYYFFFEDYSDHPSIRYF